MVNLIKSAYLATIFKLQTNKEITLEIGRVIRPCYNAIYKCEKSDNLEIEINSENILFENKINHSNSEKIDKIIFLDNLNGNGMFDSSSLYLFKYSSNEEFYEILEKFKNIIFDVKICKILVDQSTFHFLKKSFENSKTLLEKRTLIIKIKETGPFWIQILFPIIVTISAGFIYYFGKYVVKKLSKLDPIFADFDISSSNLLKFKEIPDQSMAQCTICFEEFVPDDDIRVLGCFHYYHPACIDRWLIGHSRKCPCCRHPIEINEKI